jgi:esterase/lipase superfamily enzyme
LIGGIALWTFVAGRMTADAGPSRIYYGGERGELELGTCTVSIPRTHRVGDLESPSVLKLEFREDPSRHVMLVGVEPQPADEFFSDLRAKVDRSSERAAFVFVHGYNVTFDDAARRTAQVAYDLNYDGAPILYSWPSQGKLSGYTVDENNVEWTVPHLKQFLLDLAGRSGAAQIHLVAHSMGNRALADALRQLAYENPPARPLFREVILTAPDIDAEVFRRDLAPAIARTADRVTLYASSNDEALALSKQVHGYPRAGDSGGQLVVVPGIDTIDVSAVDTSLMGHSYYGSNDTVLADMFALIHQSMPPDKRRWLRSERLGMLRYWIFERR